MHVHVHVRTHTHIGMHIFMICMHTHTDTHTHTCTHTYVHTHVYTHTHAHTNTDIADALWHVALSVKLDCEHLSHTLQMKWDFACVLQAAHINFHVCSKSMISMETSTCLHKCLIATFHLHPARWQHCSVLRAFPEDNSLTKFLAKKSKGKTDHVKTAYLPKSMRNSPRTVQSHYKFFTFSHSCCTHMHWWHISCCNGSNWRSRLCS